MRERFRVLWEAASSEPYARAEKLRSYALVIAHSERNILHIGADKLAKVRNIIHVRYLKRKKIVRRIFYHLGASPRHTYGRQAKRLVYFFKLLTRAVRFRADYYAPCVQRVMNGAALR